MIDCEGVCVRLFVCVYVFDYECVCVFDCEDIYVGYVCD